ncbi:uncharacterized protein [Rutidosis leptorrhynchoides]|uniref:uncharacterized protein n=1 Tax=Rutidosis leptorrhynchoides TaxID=125765 RepID=UPI003A99215D
MGVSKVETDNMVECFGYMAGTLPITYLGLKIGSTMKTSIDWGPLLKNSGKDLRIGKRAPSNVVNKLEFLRHCFFWGGSNDVSKMAWVKWETCLMPHNKGGLNIGSLAIKNQALLDK